MSAIPRGAERLGAMKRTRRESRRRREPSARPAAEHVLRLTVGRAFPDGPFLVVGSCFHGFGHDAADGKTCLEYASTHSPGHAYGGQEIVHCNFTMFWPPG